MKEKMLSHDELVSFRGGSGDGEGCNQGQGNLYHCSCAANQSFFLTADNLSHANFCAVYGYCSGGPADCESA